MIKCSLNSKFPSVHADTPSVASCESFTNYFLEKTQLDFLRLLIQLLKCSQSVFFISIVSVME